jgi:serine/threonine protein kinase
MSRLQKQQDIIINKKFKLGAKIGGGAFGDIYSGTKVESGEPVAVKLELAASNFMQLEKEFKIYKVLRGTVGIPSVYYYGMEGDYNVMVMDMCGRSIEDLFCRCRRRFSLKTTLMVADQLLCRMEVMHAKNHIHRDIKPDNFVIGRGDRSKLIYVIDLGLSKNFRDSKTKRHIPFKEGKDLTGSPRYTAVSVHLGHEQSRRTDMESLGYVFVYFLVGMLPWERLKDEGTVLQKNEKIKAMKISTSTEQLCKGLPVEFALYFDHIRSLGFEDRPDYAYLKQLFRDLFFHEGFEYDSVYDWDLAAELANETLLL